MVLVIPSWQCDHAIEMISSAAAVKGLGLIFFTFPVEGIISEDLADYQELVPELGQTK